MKREDLTREFQDKKLRIEFVDGQTQQVLVNMVCECNEHEECRGIVYEVFAERPSQTYWTEMKYIKSFEVIGSEA